MKGAVQALRGRPTDLEELMGAVTTRPDPARGRDIQRRACGAPADPRAECLPEAQCTSRAIIDA